jgi:hypothetical protein
MARKSRHSSSRKMKHTRKHKTHRRKTHRRKTHRRRGGSALSGAPVNYHLSGDWSSRMSLGQGADYFKYHEGQHGGSALGMGKFPEAVMDPGLPQALRGPAHIGGLDKAFADVRGLRDAPYDTAPTAPTTGGKRRHSKHRKTHSKKKHTKSHSKKRSHSRKHRRTHRRSRGGSLGYAPFPSTGMLLSSPQQYAQAGLNPEWKTDVAFTDAKIRETQ